MAKVLVTVYDVKAETFNIPACFESIQDAKRAFFDICQDKNTIIGRHPEDFRLYLVGNFDVCTGTLSVLERAPLTDGTEYICMMAHKDNEVTNE